MKIVKLVENNSAGQIKIVVTHFVCGIKMWHLSEQAYHCCHCWDENTAHKTMVLYKQRVISTLQRMCYDSHYLANMLQAITKINSWIHRKLKNCKPTFTCDDFILSLSRNILHGSRWQIFVILKIPYFLQALNSGIFPFRIKPQEY